MAKIRALKPETWTDDRIVEVSPLARLLFIGMWNFACDNGHLDDKPRQLKMRILPGDDCNVSDLLDELAHVGLIERKDGYIKVPRLVEHQRPDLRYLTLCDHCEHDECITYNPNDKQRHTRGTRRAPNGHTRGTRGVPATDGDGDGDGDLSRAPSARTTGPRPVNDKPADAGEKRRDLSINAKHAQKILDCGATDDRLTHIDQLIERHKPNSPRAWLKTVIANGDLDQLIEQAERPAEPNPWADIPEVDPNDWSDLDD